MKGKKSSTTLAGRSWRLLRLALCWARKVVAFELLSPLDDEGIIRRGERELSFEEEEETSIFRFKKETPPEGEKDMEEEEERFERDWGEEEEYWIDEERESCEVSEEEEEEEEEGIDSRAEEFIEWFHEQLKLQGLSNLQ